MENSVAAATNFFTDGFAMWGEKACADETKAIKAMAADNFMFVVSIVLNVLIVRIKEDIENAPTVRALTAFVSVTQFCCVMPIHTYSD